MRLAEGASEKLQRSGRQYQLQCCRLALLGHLGPCLAQNVDYLLFRMFGGKIHEVILKKHQADHVLKGLCLGIVLQALFANEGLNPGDDLAAVSALAHEFACASCMIVFQLRPPAKIADPSLGIVRPRRCPPFDMLRAGGNFQSFGCLRSETIQHSAHSAAVCQFARLTVFTSGDHVRIPRVRQVDGRYHGVISIIHEVRLSLHCAAPKPNFAFSPAQRVKTEVPEIGEQLGMVLAPYRIDYLLASQDGDIKLPRHRLNAVSHVDGIANHREFDAPLASDVAKHYLAMVETDANSQRLKPRGYALTVPCNDFLSHQARTPHGVGGIVETGFGGSECRHEPVAQKFVERAAVGEHGIFEDGKILAEQGHCPDPAQACTDAGKSDDIDEQHRYDLRTGKIEPAARLHEVIDDVGGEITSQVRPFCFHIVESLLKLYTLCYVADPSDQALSSALLVDNQPPEHHPLQRIVAGSHAAFMQKSRFLLSIAFRQMGFEALQILRWKLCLEDLHLVSERALREPEYFMKPGRQIRLAG